ncbi:hypothetical protein BKA93DRAFT_800990, partial [Sparassis latifolia]
TSNFKCRYLFNGWAVSLDSCIFGLSSSARRAWYQETYIFGPFNTRGSGGHHTSSEPTLHAADSPSTGEIVLRGLLRIIARAWYAI